jgi:purine-binding chemotaxis protein CheW
MMKVTPVPRTPAYVTGVINLRGTIIPLIDIRIKFEMGAVPETMYTAIIVCRVHGVNIGFIVDRVEDVLLIGDEHLAETPRFDTSIDTSYIRSVAEYGESVMIILDLEKMFDRGEFETLHSLSPIQHTEGTVP